VRIVVKTLCLVLLLGALGIPAYLWGDGASAGAAALNSTTNSAPNQDQVVTPLHDSPPIRFDQISAEQGLSSPEVWSVLRDQRGFMWFGTTDGLNRYDGYNTTATR